MNENDSLHLRRIKLPRQKKGGPVIFTETWFANLVAQLLESFANLKIVQGTTDGQNILSSIEAQIEHGEFGGTITLPPAFDTTTGVIGSGTSQVFGGNGAPSDETLPVGNYISGVNPNCYVDETNKNLYFCSQAGTQATAVWTLISGGTQVQQFKIISIAGASVNGQASNSSTSVVIQKPTELSNLGGETIDGDNIIYSNYSPDFNSRLATDSGGNSETQFITPRYVVGSEIVAILFTPFGGGAQAWIEFSPSRQWGGVN